MNRINQAVLSAKIRMENMICGFAEDETGDFAQYGLLIIIVVAIAGIVSNALTGWVGTVMQKLLDFTA